MPNSDSYDQKWHLPGSSIEAFTTLRQDPNSPTATTWQRADTAQGISNCHLSTLASISSPDMTRNRPPPGRIWGITLSTFPLDDDLMLPLYEHHLTTRTASKEPDAYKDMPAERIVRPSAGTRRPWAVDDMFIEAKPLQNVDYLSHDWKEEDLWTSWHFVTAFSDDYSADIRLGNALWRTWAKAKNRLGTLAPEKLNW